MSVAGLQKVLRSHLESAFDNYPGDGSGRSAVAVAQSKAIRAAHATAGIWMSWTFSTDPRSRGAPDLPLQPSFHRAHCRVSRALTQILRYANVYIDHGAEFSSGNWRKVFVYRWTRGWSIYLNHKCIGEKNERCSHAHAS